MDYFSKFLKKGDGASSSSNKDVVLLSTPVKATADDVIPVEIPAPNVTEAHSCDDHEDPTVGNNSTKKCIERDANGHIPLWETKIRKTVKPDKLVWAPLYRFRDQLFCARLCDSDEINRDVYIKTPLMEGTCVVEMIRAPKTKAEDTKLLVVRKDKVIPYFGRGTKVDEIDKSKWSELHLKKLKAVLADKWNKADGEYVYNEIVTASNSYLKEALIFEKASADSIMRQRSPQYHAPKIEVIDEEGLALFGKHTKHEQETLCIGDHVSFFSELNCDITVRARIIGFSDDPLVPLVLDNGGLVHLHKRLRKFQAVLQEVNPLGYDPNSGHYCNLSEYRLDMPKVSAGSQSSGRKDKRGKTEEPMMEASKHAKAASQRSDSSDQSTRSDRSSRSSGGSGTSAVVSQDDSVTSLSVTATEASTTGSGSLAPTESLSQWSAADCCEVVDLSTLQQQHEKVEALKEKVEGSARKRSRASSQEEDLLSPSKATRSSRRAVGHSPSTNPIP